MILSIGEILVDMIDREGTGYVPHLGGAPFNVAVGAIRCGAKVAFAGTVGEDIWGEFVREEVSRYGVDSHISVDPARNTTLAFVKLVEGERSFGFVRKAGADSKLDREDIFKLLDGAILLHVGSLPLSDPEGRKVIYDAVEYARE
ncbi:MAG: carbohydrate kinase, partial [Clostridia bacterium]|nr:carbohydrate kinase [Clostridia bacterium]